LSDSSATVEVIWLKGEDRVAYTPVQVCGFNVSVNEEEAIEAGQT